MCDIAFFRSLYLVYCAIQDNNNEPKQLKIRSNKRVIFDDNVEFHDTYDMDYLREHDLVDKIWWTRKEEAIRIHQGGFVRKMV